MEILYFMVLQVVTIGCVARLIKYNKYMYSVVKRYDEERDLEEKKQLMVSKGDD